MFATLLGFRNQVKMNTKDLYIQEVYNTVSKTSTEVNDL